MEENYVKLSEEQLYDSVFWTAINMLRQYLPMLVNEAFGEHFSQNAQVTLLPGKEAVEAGNKGKYSFSKRDMDSMFILSEMLEEYVEKKYHFECEVKGDRSVAIRIAEYSSGYAFHHVTQTEAGAEIDIPHSAVIFLRSDSANIHQFTNRIRYPGGVVEFIVPVIRIKDYSLEELFEKRLLLLIPFHVFIFSNKEFAAMNTEGGNIAEIEELLEDIHTRLEELVTANEIDRTQAWNIMRYTGMVLEKLTARYSCVKEEVKKVMGGYIIKTDIDIAIEKGREEGRILEFISIRREDGYSDSEIISDIMIRFGKNLDEATEAVVNLDLMV